MKTDVDKLQWHDALLLGLTIDRSNPGHVDTIELSIGWGDGKRSTALFSDCYAMQSKMNFGVVAQETIRSLIVSDEGADLSAIKEAFKRIGVAIPNLKCSTLETNSTASVIKIFALALEIIPIN